MTTSAFNATVVYIQDSKLFAIGLTVEQISQCSGSWHERGVDSTKIFLSENRKSPSVLWKGRSQK
jgi:hypothetical protein